jgi:hypothetical protein
VQRHRVVDHQRPLDGAGDRAEHDVDAVRLQERDAVGAAHLHDLQLDLHQPGEFPRDVGVEAVDLVLLVEQPEGGQGRVDAGPQLLRLKHLVERPGGRDPRGQNRHGHRRRGEEEGAAAADEAFGRRGHLVRPLSGLCTMLVQAPTFGAD